MIISEKRIHLYEKTFVVLKNHFTYIETFKSTFPFLYTAIT